MSMDYEEVEKAYHDRLTGAAALVRKGAAANDAGDLVVAKRKDGQVAVAFLAWVLLATPLDSFRREQPWYVYDLEDQPRWLPEGVAFTYSEP